jgi:hypothetical protein
VARLRRLSPHRPLTSSFDTCAPREDVIRTASGSEGYSSASCGAGSSSRS